MLDDATRWDIYHKKNYHEDTWNSDYAEEVEKEFPKGALIVELGAGTGADALYFLRRGHSLIALDISEFALDLLQKKAKDEGLAKNLVVRQVDFGLHKIPVKDSSVDVAYSRISLNYFGSKQTTKIFADILRILKPGGHAYLTLKSSDDPVEMEYLEKSASVYEPNVYIEGGMLRSRFTVEQLKQILISAGIKTGDVRPLQEDLGKKGEGHHPILHVNEIRFTKH